jgi:Rieske Fe-S protein
MTTICTHRQCDIAQTGTVTSSGLECSCHGSRFDRNGAVTAGPAQSALAHYSVDLAADGAITVRADVVVGDAVRTPVPG